MVSDATSFIASQRSQLAGPTLPLNSVEEVSGTGHIHGDAGLAGRLEHFLITNGPTRLDDGL